MENKKLSMEEFNLKLQAIKDSLLFYDSRHYDSKRFGLALSNGDKINYSIPENAVAHLLGVNTNYLLGTSFLSPKSKSSIDVLRELCNTDNWYNLYGRYPEGRLDLNQLFSSNFDKKIEIFENNIKPLLQNIEFVCKINRDKIHQQGVDYMDIDYMICTKDEQDRYLVLGLTLMDKYYTGRTSMVFDNLEEFKNKFKDILYDQQMTFAYSFSMSDFYNNDSFHKPFSLKNDIKNSKVKGLLRYRDMFSTNVDVTQDYLFTAAQNDNQYTISKEITECMKSGEFIDLNYLISRYRYIPESIKIIIDQYNDLLCHGSNLDTSAKYSEVDQENRNLKNQLATEISKNVELYNENSELRKKITELEAEKASLLSFKEDFVKVYTKHIGK